MKRWLVALFRPVGRTPDAADAVAYERAARDAYRSAAFADIVPASPPSSAPIPTMSDVSAGVARTAETLEGAVRPWGARAWSATPSTVTAEAITAEAIAVMPTFADQEADADWEVGVVDVDASRSSREGGDTAPEFLMRTPPSVGMTVDAFFEGLVRRVESDR